LVVANGGAAFLLFASITYGTFQALAQLSLP